MNRPASRSGSPGLALAWVLTLALVAGDEGCAVYNDSCPVAEPEVWGQVNTDLDIRENFVRQCEAPVGNLIADAMLAYDYGLRDSQGERIIPRVALINSGAIRDAVSCGATGETRAAIPRGPVTDQDILQLLPFQNTIVVVRLTGSQLKDVLEWGVSSLGLPGEAGQEGHFLQLGAEGGAAVTIDCSRQQQQLDAERRTIVDHGSRVITARLAGQPLEPAGVYFVAVLEFMVGTNDIGVPNDGFAALHQPGIDIMPTHVPLTEVVRLWLGQPHGGDYPVVEGRLLYQQCEVDCGG